MLYENHERRIIRLILSLPPRNELQLRLMVAMLIEADPETGEIPGRGDLTPRQVLSETANIRLEGSLKIGLAALRKADILRTERVYAKGERLGGDKLFFNWVAIQDQTRRAA